MFFNVRQESRMFLELVRKALGGKLSVHENEQFEKLLREQPEMRREYEELERELADSKSNKLWEKGLRVLLRVPQSGDVQYLEEVKQSDPLAWKDFMQGAFIMRIMTQSSTLELPPSTEYKLTAEEQEQLLWKIKDARKQKSQNRLKKSPPLS